MSASTISSMGNALQRVYTPDVFDFYQNQNCEFWMKLQKETKLFSNPIGAGLYFEIPLQSAQNIGLISEAGTYPTAKSSTYLQGTVSLCNFAADIEISNLLAFVGKEGGAWKNVLKREMKTCLDDTTKNVNRIYAGTHGTGRLGQVLSTVTSSTTVQVKFPFRELLIRPNMLLAAYTADTSGSVRDSMTAAKVTKIVKSTGTLTLDSGYSLTADDHLYLSGSYGNAPNGLLGLVDDGSLLTSVHGNSRDTYEELKSVVHGNGGTLRDQTEDQVVQASQAVFQESGAAIDTIIMNTGQWAEYLQYTRLDRRYPQAGAGVPSYDTGNKAKSQFFLNGRGVDIEVMTDIRPRTIFGLTKSTFRRIGMDAPQWLDLGGTQFAIALSGGAYTSAKQAFIEFYSNLLCFQPNANFRIDDLSDLGLCGAARGGTDL